MYDKKLLVPFHSSAPKNGWCLSKEEGDKMRTLIQECTYFEVANSDHMVYADNADEFYPQFERFINAVV